MTGIVAVGASFGDLLRSLRRKAGFSREALAERADISVEAVRAYERRLRSPRRETLALLIGALHLTGEERTEFENAALRNRFAPAASTSVPGNNLPWQGTSFVGREREIEEISRLLSPRQLVTITGSGGIGKTRTSLEVASRIASPRDGIRFVELAPIGEGAFVLSRLASVLELSLPEQPNLLAALVAAIRGRQLLLVIDNCEHVLSAVREVAVAILEACPHISLLASSRERLGIGGERVYRLSTLSVPTEAVELLTARASEHDFSIADDDLGLATDICHRLDGVALAIELAAARLPMLGLSELRIQLTKHFKVISSTRHDLAARQRAMDATIAWSHDLLDERERVLFRRLAIFSSGWTLESATGVCSDSALLEGEIFDTLFSLLEKSLVQVDLDVTPPRYSFFEATRAYARERLEESSEGVWLSRRHAQCVAVFAERIYGIYGGVPRGRWALEAAPELDNTLAALDWAFGPEGDAKLAGQITGALQGFWRTTGLADVGRRYVTAALERLAPNEYPAMVARLLIAQIRYIHGAERVRSMRRAIALAANEDDPLLLARCYAMLSTAYAEIGEYTDAEGANLRAAALLSDLGMLRSGLYSNLLADRSQVLLMHGRLDEARSGLTEAMSLAVALEDDWSTLLCQGIFVEIELTAGDAKQAERLAQEAIASTRRINNTHIEGALLDTLACCQLVLGRADAADISARAALNLAVLNSNPLGLHLAIQHLAAIAALRGNGARAARLFGYVTAWYKRIDFQQTQGSQKSHEILVESLNKQLHTDEIAALTAQGAQLSVDDAIDEALRMN